MAAAVRGELAQNSKRKTRARRRSYPQKIRVRLFTPNSFVRSFLPVYPMHQRSSRGTETRGNYWKGREPTNASERASAREGAGGTRRRRATKYYHLAGSSRPGEISRGLSRNWFLFVTRSCVDAAAAVVAATTIVVVIILIVLVLVSVVVVVRTDLINDAADSEVQRFSLWGPKRFAVIKGRLRSPCARVLALIHRELESPSLPPRAPPQPPSPLPSRAPRHYRRPRRRITARYRCRSPRSPACQRQPSSFLPLSFPLSPVLFPSISRSVATCVPPPPTDSRNTILPPVAVQYA